MGHASLVVVMLLLYNWTVIYATGGGDDAARPSIFEINLKSKVKSSKLKCKAKYGGCGQDDDSDVIRGGDILVDPSEPKPRSKIKVNAGGPGLNAEMIAIPLFSWHQKLWQSRELPYVITSSVNPFRGVIMSAMKGIRDNTANCLKFRPKRPADKWWLEFYYGSGCFSDVGRKYWKTGATRISIGLNCNYKDIVQHELLHALGFSHEQSRTDRDKYVQIFWKRINKGMDINFDKSEITASYYFQTPYDYKSLMHYDRKAFSIGGRRHTIEKKGDPNFKLGSRAMSPMDKEELKRMYSCRSPNGWSPWIQTPCMCTEDKGFCTRSKVKICFGTRPCASKQPQQYGTQYASKICQPKDEGKEKIIGLTPTFSLRPDKVTGGAVKRWSAYGACQAKCDCGWGFQERTSGTDRQAKLCRLKRCGGGLRGDSDFNTVNTWTHARFPKRGGVASAAPRSALSVLRSRMFQKSNKRKCLMFRYNMAGNDGQLTALMEYKLKGRVRRKPLAFRASKSTGTWKRAAINVPKLNQNYKLVIKANRRGGKKSKISVDDIFVDMGGCPTGLNVCRDVKSKRYCTSRGKRGNCNHKNLLVRRMMYFGCCSTCQAAAYRNKGAQRCQDKKKACKTWAKSNECKNNKVWMTKNCCKSCAFYGSCKR